MVQSVPQPPQPPVRLVVAQRPRDQLFSGSLEDTSITSSDATHQVYHQYYYPTYHIYQLYRAVACTHFPLLFGARCGSVAPFFSARARYVCTKALENTGILYVLKKFCRRQRWLLFAGVLARHHNRRLPKQVIIEKNVGGEDPGRILFEVTLVAKTVGGRFQSC